ncbi:MAG TPA: nucleotide exchange factor GrpE [Candidatus Baltobacteraceae bacterium]|jgi:molecular chaperone GrpE|nr:nucleotide exchange factor GrpE [Candidatus Baltobacteraceae bacterium]
MEDVEARAEDFRQKYLYAMAEIENVRKRSARQSEETVQAFKRRLLLRLLPVLDNLQRALAFRDSDEMREGLAATLRGFEEALEAEGVRPILTTGERFDPNLAEAIGTERVLDEQNDTVLAEAQRGYLLGRDLLRPARVIVVKNE